MDRDASSTITKSILIKSNIGEVLPASTKPSVYDSLHLNDLGLSREAYDYAIKGLNSLRSEGKLSNDTIISIIDFSLSSARKRLFVIDLKHYKMLYNTYVAHGRNSGDEYANEFSNDPSSFKSSLGFYITGQTYSGAYGLSLHLNGIERGFNDKALHRGIVLHGSHYVGDEYLQRRKLLGRSYGCPAVPKYECNTIINFIKNGSCMFIYYPAKHYLDKSKILNS